MRCAFVLERDILHKQARHPSFDCRRSPQAILLKGPYANRRLSAQKGFDDFSFNI